MEYKDPVFLSGALRSGTTVLGLMLRYHPEVIAPGEFDFLFECIDDVGNYPQMDKYTDWLKRDRIFKAHALNLERTRSFKENIESFVLQLSESEKILSLNVHRNFHRIPTLFPTARYIHLLRDARDVARSSIGMGWSGNVYYGVDHWINTEKSWDLLKPSLNSNQYIEIKFEQLITNPKETLAKICQFLTIPFSEKMLNYDDGTTYKKPDVSLIKQWERKQSKKQVQLVEYKAKEMMLSRGYSVSGYPALEPGLIDKVSLYFQNKLYRMRFGIKNFGAGLYFTEKLTRFPFLKRWHEDCILKMNDLEIKLLK